MIKILHPDVIDLNDEDVYENIFHQGKWAGIFQFTEKGAQTFATKAQPKSIIDIAAITSIYRPGPLSAGLISSMSLLSMILYRLIIFMSL